MLRADFMPATGSLVIEGDDDGFEDVGIVLEALLRTSPPTHEHMYGEGLGENDLDTAGNVQALTWQVVRGEGERLGALVLGESEVELRLSSEVVERLRDVAETMLPGQSKSFSSTGHGCDDCHFLSLVLQRV